ncbi:hypothetical protein OCC_10444 [Thermococcus litoralis DSM 5473]|uniref:Uncharacterized protein n=1 Tax=Thermococcus litoralis (strain ATCC 51850 / DSM 5473 / JCM 8560 / NS-C) TaxID=523849 RepID=H3ZR51_THELN|nr:hypothetical protein [Thermococcus litoralis]EHR77520.1 hypothetical protein OCC_10444 [Thermococcus litoralis DSM 5473]
MQFKKKLVMVNLIGIVILLGIFGGMMLYAQKQMGHNITTELHNPTIEQAGDLTTRIAYGVARHYEGVFQ